MAEFTGSGSTGSSSTGPSIDEQIKLAELQARQLDLQLKQEELVAKKLEIQERLANIDEGKARQEKRLLLKRQFEADLKSKAKVFGQAKATDELRQNVCTHRKGGMASPRDMRVLHEGGDSEKRSIIRHRMINGDMWVRCTRCGKTWAPPVKKNFFFDAEGRQVAQADGVFDLGKFNDAHKEWNEAAVKFSTNTTPSSSVVVTFHQWDSKTRTWVDGNDAYRESVASTNLR